MLHRWDWEIDIDIKIDISRKVSVSEMSMCVKEGGRGLGSERKWSTRHNNCPSHTVPHPPSFPHLFIYLITPYPSRPLSAPHACTSSPSTADMVSAIRQELSDLAAVLRDRNRARSPLDPVQCSRYSSTAAHCSRRVK